MTTSAQESAVTSNGAAPLASPDSELHVPITIHRISTLNDFNKENGHRGHEEVGEQPKVTERLSSACSKITAARVCSGFLSLLPFINTLRTYNLKSDLPKDIIAGLTVGIMHVPQGMAYALLASMPPIYGLYVSLIPPLFYFMFGTSRHISMGTFAVICLMLGSVVDRYECEQYDPAVVIGGGASSNVVVPLGGGANDTASRLIDSLLPTTNASYVDTPPSSASAVVQETLSPVGKRFSSDIQCRLAVVTTTTLAASLVQFLMWVLRLGFVTVYLSTPLTRGLTTGAACHVFTSQIKHLFGLKVLKFSGPLNLVLKYIDMASNVSLINYMVVLFGVVCIVVLVFFKEFVNPKFKAKFHLPLPIELLIVIFATLTSFFFDLKDKMSFDVVGSIPTGLPAPKSPAFYLLSEVISDSFSIAIVSFAVNVSLGKLFASKHNYPLDSNQELLALSLTNMFGSFCNCFYSAGSLSRSLVCEGVGAVTQVASLFSGLFLLFVIFAIGPLFTALPKAALAAIIVVNLKGMFLQFSDLSYLWKVSKFDCMTWIVVFVAVLLLDVALGLFVGFIFCLFTVIWRSQTPYSTILGRIGDTQVFDDVANYDNVELLDSVKIFRFESALYFANCEYFAERLNKVANLKSLIAKQTKSTQHNDSTSSTENTEMVTVTLMDKAQILRHVIIDCSTIAYIDTTALSLLKQIILTYKKVNVTILIAACKGGVLTTMHQSDFFDKVDANCLYVSVADAVNAVQS